MTTGRPADALRRHPLLVHLSLLVTVTIWGMTFVAIKYVSERTGAPGVVMLRAGLSSLCFAVLLFVVGRGVPRMPAIVWKRMALLAFLGVVVNNLALAHSQPYITAALASLIVTSNPVFTTLFSRILLGEPLTRRKVSGMTVAFAGFMIVLLWGGSNAEFSADNALGVLILVCAPLGWAIYTVLSKPLLTAYEPHVVAGVTTILGGLMLAPYMLWHVDAAADVARLGWTGWLAAFTMSVLAIFVAYTLWYRGLRRLEPSQVAVYMYLTPFFGVVAAGLMLGETITAWLLLGGATILAGVMITNSGRRPRADPLDASIQPVRRAIRPVAD
jgi:drug/metabolite transporter (DMT)-like permease